MTGDVVATGTVRVGGRPAAGAVVTVIDADGGQVGTARAGDGGAFTVVRAGDGRAHLLVVQAGGCSHVELLSGTGPHARDVALATPPPILAPVPLPSREVPTAP